MAQVAPGGPGMPGMSRPGGPGMPGGGDAAAMSRMPGMGPRGPGMGSGGPPGMGGPGGLRGGGLGGPGQEDNEPADFHSPEGAVKAFLAALKAKDLDRLNEATALRAQSRLTPRRAKNSSTRSST